MKVRIDLPSLREQTPSRLSTSLPAKILDYPHEALPPLAAWRKSDVGKYKPFKTCAHNTLGSENILGVELANSVEWKEFSFRNPNPPSFFATVIASHLVDPAQGVFPLWSSLLVPKQVMNFRYSES